METQYRLRGEIKDFSFEVDFDTQTECWGVFGCESGFCYSTWCSEEEAASRLQEMTE